MVLVVVRCGVTPRITAAGLRPAAESVIGPRTKRELGLESILPVGSDVKAVTDKRPRQDARACSPRRVTEPGPVKSCPPDASGLRNLKVGLGRGLEGPTADGLGYIAVLRADGSSVRRPETSTLGRTADRRAPSGDTTPNTPKKTR